MFDNKKIKTICERAVGATDRKYINALAREVSEEAWLCRAHIARNSANAAICPGRLVFNPDVDNPFEQGWVPFKAKYNMELRRYFDIFKGEDIVECESGVFLVRLYEVHTDSDEATSEVLYCCDGKCVVFTEPQLEYILEDGFTRSNSHGLYIYYDPVECTLHFSKLRANDFWISGISKEEYTEFRDKLLIKMRLGKSDSVVIGSVKVNPYVEEDAGAYIVTYTFTDLNSKSKVSREYKTFDKPWSRRYYM